MGSHTYVLEGSVAEMSLAESLIDRYLSSKYCEGELSSLKRESWYKQLQALVKSHGVKLESYQASNGTTVIDISSKLPQEVGDLLARLKAFNKKHIGWDLKTKIDDRLFYVRISG